MAVWIELVLCDLLFCVSIDYPLHRGSFQQKLGNQPRPARPLREGGEAPCLAPSLI